MKSKSSIALAVVAAWRSSSPACAFAAQGRDEGQDQGRSPAASTATSRATKEKCANGRKVTLYKQKGDDPDPGGDKKIGSDIAQANGDKYMWSTGNTGSTKGYFYAYAKKTKGCDDGISDTIKAQTSDEILAGVRLPRPPDLLARPLLRPIRGDEVVVG